MIKDIDPKYILLTQIRKNPKKVQIHDLETDKVVLYRSIYKAALALDKNTGVIGMYICIMVKYGGAGTRLMY